MTRIHYMDNLRASAMLLGIFFHAALAYAAPIQDFWFIRDEQGSRVLDILVNFSHAFRMPLFFFIAGYLGHYLLQRRGLKGFLRHRFIRIVLPFITFLPLLAVTSIAVLYFALEYLSQPSPMLEFLQEQAKAKSGTVGDIGTLHLWFLYYLAFFSIIAVALSAIKSSAVTHFINWLRSTVWPVIFLPLFLAPGLFLAGTPTPSPDRLMPAFWAFGFFGLFFAYGWILFGAEILIDRISVYGSAIATVAVICFGYYYLLSPELTYPLTEIPQSKALLLALLRAYASAYLVLAILALGKRFFNTANRHVRYLADASYWLYLVHLPLVVFAQTLLAELQMNLWIKFAIASLGPLAVGLVSYALFVRYTPIGTMLNGKKTRPNASEAETTVKNSYSTS